MWNVEKRVHVGRMWWNTWKNGFRFSVPSSTANVSRIDLIEARTNRAEKSKADTTGIFRLVEGRKEEWLSGETERKHKSSFSAIFYRKKLLSLSTDYPGERSDDKTSNGMREPTVYWLISRRFPDTDCV